MTLLFFTSCAANLVKGTVWEGEFDKNLNIYGYFKPDDTMEFFFEQDGFENTFIKVDGDYELSNTDTFKCTLEGNTPGDITYNVQLSGSLNYSAGSGSGTYKIKESSGSNSSYALTEGKWTLEKVSSN